MSDESVTPVAIVGSADNNLIKKWDVKVNACQQARINFERQWHFNMAFYQGRQWIMYQQSAANKSGYMLSEPQPTSPYQVRHTANRIRRIIRTEVSKLSKEEPQFYCVPKSTEESDRAAALAGDSVAEYFIYGKHFNSIRTQATFWTSITGTGYIKAFYDEYRKELDGQDGAIVYEAPSPFHILVPNLQLIDIQEQDYVVHVRTLSAEQVESFYDVKIEPTSDVASTIMDSRFLQSVGIKNTKNEREKQCLVKEVWLKKSKDFPNGAMFVYGEGRLLYMYEPTVALDTPPDPNAPEQLELPSMMTPDQVPDMEVPKSIHEGLAGYDTKFPFRHGRYPFAKIIHIPSGMFYGESVIKDLIPLQKEYNRTRSIMLEHRNMAGKPQWSYIRGSIEPKHFTSKPGLLLAVNVGFDPPQALEQPGLPTSTAAELEVTIRDMDDAAAQSEITKGRTPPGIEAASAIAYLQEENDSILYHTVLSLEDAVQEVGSQTLELVHEFWDQDRIVSITSRNQAYEVHKFKAANLKPGMDFRVETGSMAPRSTAAKQAFITELIKMGVIPPQQGMRYLQMNETNKMYEELMLDNRHAQRENMIMQESGQPMYRDTGEVQPGPETINPETGEPMQIPQPVMATAEKVDQFGQPILQQNPETGTMEPITYQVTIRPFDNHQIHITEHESFMKTQEWEMLPAAIQKIFQDHVDEHKEEILKERAAVEQHQMSQEFPGEGESPSEATPENVTQTPQEAPAYA